jgi:predicted MFS family arabinose efflux permease
MSNTSNQISDDAPTVQRADLNAMPPVSRPGFAASSSGKHGWYVATLLFLIGAFNLMDRQILAILLEPIKRDLRLSDTAMGLLTGFAFVAFYTLTSVPIARRADSHSRRNIIALALIFWSAMTSLSALATSFVQLALLRVGVGIAESGSGPAGQSMLADLFPPSQRTAAMSMLAIAPPVGVMLAFIIGGAVNEHLGWRMTLVCVGAPGMFLALLWWVTVKEPLRGASDALLTDNKRYELWDIVRYLSSRKSFRALTLGSSLATFTVMVMIVWSPAYLERVYGISSTQVGLSLGIATGLGGIAGGLGAGILAQRLMARDLAWLLRVPAFTSLVAAPLAAGFLLLGKSPAALPIFFGIVFCSAAMLAPVMSATQLVVKAQMRAVAAALVTLTFNFIGTGLGPFAVGLMSDILAPRLGLRALPAAMWLAVIASVGAALAFAIGARHLRKDVIHASR